MSFEFRLSSAIIFFAAGAIFLLSILVFVVLGVFVFSSFAGLSLISGSVLFISEDPSDS